MNMCRKPTWNVPSNRIQARATKDMVLLHSSSVAAKKLHMQVKLLCFSMSDPVDKIQYVVSPDNWNASKQ